MGSPNNSLTNNNISCLCRTICGRRLGWHLESMLTDVEVRAILGDHIYNLDIWQHSIVDLELLKTPANIHNFNKLVDLAESRWQVYVAEHAANPTALNQLQYNISKIPGIAKAIEATSGYDLGWGGDVRYGEPSYHISDSAAKLYTCPQGLTYIDITADNNAAVPSVKGDLTESFSFLPPKQFVNIGCVISYLELGADPQLFMGEAEFAQNVDAILLPGGYLRVWAHHAELLTMLGVWHKLGYKIVGNVEYYDSENLLDDPVNAVELVALLQKP